MANAKKSAIVQEIQEKLSRSKFTLLTDYRGLKVKDLEELKRAIETEQAEYKIVKNTLLKIAVQEQSLPELRNLESPTAVLFCYADEVSPLKKLMQFAKNLELPKLKIGILNNALIDERQIQKLATLPTREVLIGKTLSSLNSPLFRLHRALNYNLQSLHSLLSQIKNKNN